jgi:hypothetical protein
MSQVARPTTPGVYDPKALTAMGMAFDVALDAFPDKRGPNTPGTGTALTSIWLTREKQIPRDFPDWLSSE